MRMIRRSLELANRDPLDPDALEERAEIWAEECFRTIPENRLVDAFRRAYDDHANPFPLNGHDLKLAFEKIRAEEAAAAKIEREAHVKRLQAQGAVANRWECPSCLNSGWEIVAVFSETGRQYRAAKRCGTCRYWDAEDRKHREQ